MTGLWRTLLLSGAVATLGAGAVAIATASCSQTTTNAPLVTFQRAQRVDVVCLQVFTPPDVNGNQLSIVPPLPVRQEECAPVPPNVNGSALPYHLFALVTQTARGEVAVVDLTAGNVIDLDRSTPGINFIPVGALPTDIAVTPDAQMFFVAAAEVNKPAIYAIPSTRVLGDSQWPATAGDAGLPPVTLASWPSCSLPAAPGPIAVIPTKDDATDAGGTGTGDAGIGADGGNFAQVPIGHYVLTVVLPGDDRTPARVLTIDPAPLLKGAQIEVDAGGSVVAPGSLVPCPILASLTLGGAPASAAPVGPAWDDGIRYDAGAGTAFDPFTREPMPAARCSALDAGGDAGGDGGAGPAVTGLPHASAAVTADRILYVADDVVPVIHRIDLSVAGGPRELLPLRATSQTNPARVVAVGGLAISPPTRDYRRYLYAIDRKDSPASLMVFDVTDPATSPLVPLVRPHGELNPFEAPDRLAFNSPVATIAFVRHDYPLAQNANGGVVGAVQTGLLCNPNPNAGLDQGPFTDPGANYRATLNNLSQLLGPQRLRGIFAFATLSNGTVETIDVDDWDGPCRRPDPMSGFTSDTAPPEPAPTSANDLDPYHAPVADAGSTSGDPTTTEGYFPVSAPNRPRSFYYLRSDPTTGIHIPNLPTPPQLSDNTGGLIPATGPNSQVNPILLPTATKLADPYADTVTDFDTTPNVRFAYEDPETQIDQNWTVTYEGTLPTYTGMELGVQTFDGFATLTLGVPGNSADASAFGEGHLCRRGVEDLDVGAARARQILSPAPAPYPDPPNQTPAYAPLGLEQRLVDYIQLSDELLNPVDPYWTEDNDCWQWDPPATVNPGDRYNACFSTFGFSTDQNPTRDFPVLEAFDDHFVIGTFFTTPGLPGRQAASVARLESDPKRQSARALKQLKCCFHNQIAVNNMRAGGEWLAVGSSVGLLHHVTTDPATGRCVPSCEQRLVLLNSRSVAILPRDGGRALPAVFPDRNSPLAMRNPSFSYFMVSGTSGRAGGPPVEQLPARDSQWAFSTSGQFTPQTINIAASTTVVSPQSMLFIDSLGQLAVVDGASQGLVLIDLDQLIIVHNYF